MFGLVVLIVLYLVMLFASFLAPYDFTATHRNFIYAPPTRIRVVDAEGNWRARSCIPSRRLGIR